MITATSSTAGAGNSHGAWTHWLGGLEGPPRPPERSAPPGGAVACLVSRTGPSALSSIEQVLEVLLRLREHLGRRRALDALLDGDADDVAILGDADDLRQALPADLQR